MRFILILMLFSTGISANNDHGKIVEQYMDNFQDIAVAEMQRSKIPASIKLAQGMLESNWGQSDLATVANNHFGIKCGGSWNGAGYYKEDDDKNDQGQLIESCFRKFADAQESYMAHSDFLTDDKKVYRYGFLFEYDVTDYKSWAFGLKKAGYATDPKYPQKLISIIEKYDLHKYDRMFAKNSYVVENSTKRASTTISNITFPHEREITKEEKTKPETTRKTVFKKKSSELRKSSTLHYAIESNNKVRMVKAIGGESLAQLSAKVGISLEEILVFNEEYIQKEEILAAGAFVYLEKKRRKLSDGGLFHIVQEGETMESISQLYGVRLKSLYAKNRMPKNAVTVAGEKLHLRDTASLSERPRFLLPDSNRKHSFLFEDDPTVK